MRNSTVDCLVVGAGPAGLCAATYLKRLMREVLVLHTGASRAALIPRSHNYPGSPEGISGPSLLMALEQQALKHGATIEKSRVLALTRVGDTFHAKHEHGLVRAKRVLIATGIVDSNPPVQDIERAILEGQLRYCPVCDGYEARDKRICVIGPGKAALKKANFLRTYSEDITVVCPAMRDSTPSDTRDGIIKVVVAKVEAVVRRDDAIVVHHGSGSLEFDVVYPALGCNPQSTLATELGAEVDPDGALLVDKNQETSIKGLYAAGDIVSELDQITVAFGHATVAATHIHHSLPRSFRMRQLPVSTTPSAEDAAV